MAKRSPGQILNYTSMAREVMKHYFGSVPRRVFHKPTGFTNFVFEARLPEGDFIIRISSSPAKIQDYMKEQWAVGKVAEIGIPVAEILEVGNDVIPHPYMIQKKLKGMDPAFHKSRLEVIQQMGKYAALIHTIPTTGFGQVFDWSENKLSKNSTWKEFLEKEIKVEESLATLRKYKMLSPGNLDKLHITLKKIEKLDLPSVFNHGDLRLKNVIIDKEAKIIAIIDWEESSSNIPFWDLSIALHDLSIDEKEAFLKGYGLNTKKFEEISYVLKALNLINYGPALEKMDPTAAQLQHYRLRLNGDLDLYSI